MNKYLLALLLSLPSVSHATDYGVGHALFLYYFDKSARDINDFLFNDYFQLDEYPGLAQGISDVETTGLALYFCYQEKKSRGTWDITRWDDLSGNYDSTMDCVLPLAVAGTMVYVGRGGDPMVSLFNIEW